MCGYPFYDTQCGRNDKKMQRLDHVDDTNQHCSLLASTETFHTDTSNQINEFGFLKDPMDHTNRKSIPNEIFLRKSETESQTTVPYNTLQRQPALDWSHLPSTVLAILETDSSEDLLLDENVQSIQKEVAVLLEEDDYYYENEITALNSCHIRPINSKSPRKSILKNKNSCTYIDISGTYAPNNPFGLFLAAADVKDDYECFMSSQLAT